MMRMRFIDLDSWSEVMITLKTNKVRSVLTAFGIFWGVFMLVLLMGGSNGLNSMLKANFRGFATNSYYLSTRPVDLPYKGFQRGRYWSFETDDLQRLRRIPELESVTPMFLQWSVESVAKERKMTCGMRGVSTAMAQIETPSLCYGRYLNSADMYGRRKVCVIGKRVAEELFLDVENPCGQRICVQNVYFQVVGVDTRVSSFMMNAETLLTVPYTAFQDVYHRGKRVDGLAMTVKPAYTVAEVAPRVDALLKRAHFVHPDDRQALSAMNVEVMFRMIDNLFEGISALVWLIGLGTLFSGSISVGNILMVTVRERTSEIGIRRALGARPSDIMIQILSESVVLTLLSGMSGIMLAVWMLQGMELIGRQNDWNASFQISFGLAVGATFLLCLLGMLAGLAPALRAMSIKPIDAMRDE